MQCSEYYACCDAFRVIQSIPCNCLGHHLNCEKMQLFWPCLGIKITQLGKGCLPVNLWGFVPCHYGIFAFLTPPMKFALNVNKDAKFRLLLAENFCSRNSSGRNVKKSEKPACFWNFWKKLLLLNILVTFKKEHRITHTCTDTLVNVVM